MTGDRTNPIEEKPMEGPTSPGPAAEMPTPLESDMEAEISGLDVAAEISRLDVETEIGRLVEQGVRKTPRRFEATLNGSDPPSSG